MRPSRHFVRFVAAQALLPEKGLTYNHMPRMVSHMKTTLNIDDAVMAKLRQESARQQRTMSDLVEAALRLLFQTPPAKQMPALPALPVLRSGGHTVDVSDRDALHQAME